MSAIRKLMLCAFCAFVSGCKLVDFAVGEHRVDPVAVLNEELVPHKTDSVVGSAVSTPMAIDIDKYRLRVTSRSDARDGITLSEVKTPIERNEWMAFLIRRAEEHCDYHKGAIVASQSTVNGLFGATATLLGGTGALVTGVTAARILSGAAGMFTGFRAQWNEVFYQNLISSAVVRRIEELRDAQRAALLAKMANEGNNDPTTGLQTYTVQHVLLDVNRYHHLCSFYVGLVALTDDKQRLAPLAQSLDAQVTATQDASKRYKAEINELEAGGKTGSGANATDAANQRLKSLYGSLDEMERQLRSLETQRAVAVAHGARTSPVVSPDPPKNPPANKTDNGKPAADKPEEKPAAPKPGA